MSAVGSTSVCLGSGIYNIMEMRRVQRRISCVHRDTGQPLGIDLACDKFENARYTSLQ